MTRDTEILRIRRAALQRQRAAVIDEISQLVDRITDSVKSAAATTQCGKLSVLAPRAVCP